MWRHWRIWKSFYIINNILVLYSTYYPMWQDDFYILKNLMSFVLFMQFFKVSEIKRTYFIHKKKYFQDAILKQNFISCSSSIKLKFIAKYSKTICFYFTYSFMNYVRKYLYCSSEIMHLNIYVLLEYRVVFIRIWYILHLSLEICFFQRSKRR